MILDAADALARRNAAELALTEAAEALGATLDELQRHGFELQDVAELLQVDPSELTGTGPSRRLAGRASRPPKVQEPDETEGVTESRSRNLGTDLFSPFGGVGVLKGDSKSSHLFSEEPPLSRGKDPDRHLQPLGRPRWIWPVCRTDTRA